MITITLNTPELTDTGEPISSAIILLTNYVASEDIDALNSSAALQMYRTIENAIDRFNPIWLIEIPIVLKNVQSILTAGQYTNVDLDAVQGVIAGILEDGDSHGQWKPEWGTWDGLVAKDALNTAVKSMPALPDSAPTAFSATLNGTEADLVWTEAATNEFGFVIERSLTTSTGFIEIARVGYNVESYTDPLATADILSATEYFYRVAAWNNAGLSTYSAEDSITTP